MIITPGSDGLLPATSRSAVIPVSAFIDSHVSTKIKTIPNVYTDGQQTRTIGRLIVETSRKQAHSINEIAEYGSLTVHVAPG